MLLNATQVSGYGSFETIQDEDTSILEERMRPGKWSEVGFLEATQSLKDLCGQDQISLKQHQISYQQVADRLKTIFKKAHRLEQMSSVEKPLVEEKYLVEIKRTKGWQTCPFSYDCKVDCGHLKGTMDYQITDIEHQETITIPSLLPHLIRKHHFFEGGPYRNAPEKLIAFFNILPGLDYQPRYEQVAQWSFSDSSFEINSADLSYAKEVCSQVIQISTEITGYFIKGNTLSLSCSSSDSDDSDDSDDLFVSYAAAPIIVNQLSSKKDYLFLINTSETILSIPEELSIAGYLLPAVYNLKAHLYESKKNNQIILDPSNSTLSGCN